MQCIVCGKRLPLLRQLGGGAFCSEEHKREHAARKAGPGAAAAVPTQPSCENSEALPESTLPAPIPRFSDVILTRRRPRARDTMGFKGAGGVGPPPGPAPPRNAHAIAAALSASSPALSLTASHPRREAAPRLTVADAATIAVGLEEAAFEPLASSSVPFLASRTEFQLWHAALAPHLRGITICEDLPALLIAVEGSIRRRDAPDAVLRIAWSLRIRADLEGLAHPGLRVGKAAFQTPPDPELSRSTFWFPESPKQPRQRLRGPGTRQYAPRHAGLRALGEIRHAFAPGNSSSSPAPPHFRSAMSWRDLECLAAAIEPQLQRAPACEEPPALSSALWGNTVPRDETRPISWLDARLFTHAGLGLPAAPGFRARDAASPAPPDPQSSKSVPWAPDLLRPPRQRLRGPGARQHAPTHSGLSAPGEIGFGFAPADSSYLPAPPDFRSTISWRSLDRLGAAIEPRLQNALPWMEPWPTPAATCGNSFAPGDPSTGSWFQCHVSVPGSGSPARPGLRAWDAAIGSLLDPKPLPSAPWFPESPRQPRQRLRGPGARQYAPTHAGLGLPGEIGHVFAPANSSSLPAPPQFRSAISCRELDRLGAVIEPQVQKAPEFEEPAAPLSALSGNTFPRAEANPVSSLQLCLFADSGWGLLTPLGFRPQEAVPAAPLSPESSNAAPRSPDSPRTPRHRFRGPGARQYSPRKSELQRPAEIEDTLAAANSPAVSAQGGFLSAPPRLELGRCSAGIADPWLGIAPYVNQTALPLAARGCISLRDESSPTLQFVHCLPGREHQDVPAITGIRPRAEIDEVLDVSVGPEVPALVEFPLAQALPSFDVLPTPAVLTTADSVEEAVSSSDLGNAPVPPSGGILGGAVVLPYLPYASPEPPAETGGDASSEPRVEDFDVAATANAFRTLNGIGKAYTLAALDAPASPAPAASCAHILAMPEAIGGRGSSKAESALFGLNVLFPNHSGTPDLDEREPQETTCPPAGFAGEQPPLPLPGACGSVPASADFSLYPVWLPELFTLSEPRGGLRTARGFNPHSMSAPAGIGEFQHDAGPGFSGQLGFPLPAAAVSDFAEMRPPIFNAPVQNPSLPQPDAGEPFWRSALDWWSRIPGVARAVTLALPLTALAAFYVPKPTLPADAPNWSTMAAKIRDRATVDLQEDFQSGLAAWTGTPGWQSSWSHPQDGSAQPGRLALYSPTVPLRDYHLELQGYIESKGLSFVFRAADLNNYYAVKFVVKKPGPLPSVALVRYAVIGGRVEPKTEMIIPLYLREDTLYKVLVTVEGEHFSVNLNGQLVDAWSDDRLKSGGVGLFADKGEVAHLRSVQVVDQQDFLGWLCSQVSAWTADRRALGVKHE